MIVKPRVRGFICVNAHPIGCERHVREPIDYFAGQGPIDRGPKRVLVIGASTGYGLAARITSAFACGADTLGICFEHPGSATKPGSAGWYNTAAFERFAAEHGLYAKDVNGDAFSDAVKQRVIELIRQDLGQLDLVVYSLAAPRRLDPRTGVVYTGTCCNGGEGEIRTHEAREDPPVFKPDGSHASGTKSHAIAIIADALKAAQTLQFTAFRRECNSSAT